MIERAIIGIDGNCGFALLGANLQEGEAEFVEVQGKRRRAAPTDPLHALAVLGEEFGELTKAMLQLTYEPHKSSIEEVRTEALQTVAMALRLFHSLDRYEYRRGPQHEQHAQADRGAKDA